MLPACVLVEKGAANREIDIEADWQSDPLVRGESCGEGDHAISRWG
jgi:hypothetical protein